MTTLNHDILSDMIAELLQLGKRLAERRRGIPKGEYGSTQDRQRLTDALNVVKDDPVHFQLSPKSGIRTIDDVKKIVNGG